MDWNTVLFEKMRNIQTWMKMNKKTLQVLCKERGAVFVLTAILLPVLLGFVGIAYDVGNLYMHKTKLQNVTDAAALAGGAVFKERSDQKTDEKSGTRINFISNNHKLADDAATTFIDKNKIDLGSNIVIDELSALPGPKSTVPSDNDNVTIEKQNIYYRVIASDTVPLYFLPVIMSNTHDQLVRTASVAMLETTTRTTTSGGGGGSSEKGTTILDNLFTFSQSLYLPDSLKNPDLDATTKVAPNIVNTYDGAIVYTSTSSAIIQGYNPNLEGLRYMNASSGAIGTPKTFLEIIDRYTSYAENIEIDFASEKYKNIFKKKFISAENAGTRDKIDKFKHFTSSYLNEKIAAGKNIFTCDDVDAGFLKLNSRLNGNPEEPIFIMYNESRHKIEFNITTDIERPVVVVFLGTADIDVLNSSNGTFRGVIYAPLAKVKLQNNNNFKFYGNMIAKDLEIQGGPSIHQEYHLVNYLKDDPDFKDLPVYTHRTGSVTQAIYDATFKEALQELVNGTSSININGWHDQQKNHQILARVYDLLYNSGLDPVDIINNSTIPKSDFLRTWYYAYESTLKKLMARYDDFQLSDLNRIDKASWDDYVPPSGGGGGGSGETTVTKSSTLRLINPRTEENPYFNNSDI